MSAIIILFQTAFFHHCDIYIIFYSKPSINSRGIHSKCFTYSTPTMAPSPEVPVSITQEEIVHVPRLVYQHRHHHAEVEQVVDLHVPHHIEETVSVPKVEIDIVRKADGDFWGSIWR